VLTKQAMFACDLPLFMAEALLVQRDKHEFEAPAGSCAQTTLPLFAVPYTRLIGQTASCRSPPQRTGRLAGQESILNWVSPCISSRRILENRARSWGNLGQ